MVSRRGLGGFGPRKKRLDDGKNALRTALDVMVVKHGVKGTIAECGPQGFILPKPLQRGRKCIDGQIGDDGATCLKSELRRASALFETNDRAASEAGFKDASGLVWGESLPRSLVNRNMRLPPS